jgi:hypothetical protein
MEAAVRKLECVESASVNFIQQRLTLQAPDELFDSALAAAEKTIRRIEPDVRVVR